MILLKIPRWHKRMNHEYLSISRWLGLIDWLKLLDRTDVDPRCLAQLSLELHDWSDLNQPIKSCHVGTSVYPHVRGD